MATLWQQQQDSTMWINADVDGNGMALQQTDPKTTVQLVSVNSKISCL